MSSRRLHVVAVVGAFALLLGSTLLSAEPRSTRAPVNDEPTMTSTTRVASEAPQPGAPQLEAPQSDATQSGYVNPVSGSFADTFADPVVVRGPDGAWYGFATADPLAEGDSPWQRIPMARSDDLVDWEFIGPAFDADDAPPYATSDSLYWAPDVRYVDGRWLMYVFVTETEDPESGDPAGAAVAAATADSPDGPWEWADEPVVGSYLSDGVLDVIDPAHLVASDGQQYLYFGGFAGGISVAELSDDGLHVVSEPIQVTSARTYEAAYVVERDGAYYLFASSASCCTGPVSGYSVSVGKSDSPTGPFVDRDGIDMDAPAPGGTPVVGATGNTWVGPGHNGFITDLSGQDWLAYHAIDYDNAWLNEPRGLNRRPLLIDRLDWIDGWPVVRAGAGASDTPVEAPVTTAPVQDDFAAGNLSDWRAKPEPATNWSVVGSQDTARLAHEGAGSGRLRATTRVPGDARMEADLRVSAGTAGLTLGPPGPRGVRVGVDGDGSLRASAGDQSATTAIPDGRDLSDWHNLAVHVRGDQLTATLSPARLGDTVARVELELPDPPPSGVFALEATGAAEFDNVSAAELHEPVTETVPSPAAGAALPDYSDEFDGTQLSDQWTWVREDSDAAVADGAFHFPLTSTDLAGPSNDAPVPLTEAPDGDYVVETKLDLDLGETEDRSFQQAGLVVYDGDDEFVRLASVAIGDTRQVEYGREQVEGEQPLFNGTFVAPPASTVWLRIAHQVEPDADGVDRRVYRAAVSRDGENWTWRGAWTFPADTTPSLGLVAHGGAEPATVATFDYVRFHELD